MKIAIVVSTFPPYLGGIGNFAYEQAMRLQKSGSQIEIITPNYNSGKLEVQNVFGLTVKKIPSLFRYGNAAFLPGLMKLLKRGKYDIVHLHYPFFGGAEFVLLSKKTHFKLVLHYHMDAVGKDLKKLIFKFNQHTILPKLLRRADRIIVTSLNYAQNSDLAAYLVKNKDKFTEIPCGVDVDKFYPQSKDLNLLDHLSVDPFAKIILFVGGLDSAHYFKGVEYLIRAYKQTRDYGLKNSKLIIVGDGNLKPAFMDLAYQLNLFDHVIFTGKVDNNDLPKFYNLSDVVVLSSIDKSEAFGMVLIEAMACKKPVIASNLSGIDSVIDDGINGFLVEPKNIKNLANKIIETLSDSDLAETMGEKGREKVAGLYSWEKVILKITELYKTV